MGTGGTGRYWGYRWVLGVPVGRDGCCAAHVRRMLMRHGLRGDGRHDRITQLSTMLQRSPPCCNAAHHVATQPTGLATASAPAAPAASPSTGSGSGTACSSTRPSAGPPGPIVVRPIPLTPPAMLSPDPTYAARHCRQCRRLTIERFQSCTPNTRCGSSARPSCPRASVCTAAAPSPRRPPRRWRRARPRPHAPTIPQRQQCTHGCVRPSPACGCSRLGHRRSCDEISRKSVRRFKQCSAADGTCSHTRTVLVKNRACVCVCVRVWFSVESAL